MLDAHIEPQIPPQIIPLFPSKDEGVMEKYNFILLASDILSPEGKRRVFADFAKSGLLSDSFNGFNDLIALLMFRDYDNFCESLRNNIGYVTPYAGRVTDFIDKQIAGDNIKDGLSDHQIAHFKERLSKYIFSIGGSSVVEFERIVTEINTLVQELQIQQASEEGLSHEAYEKGFSKLHSLLFNDVRRLQSMELLG